MPFLIRVIVQLQFVFPRFNSQNFKNTIIHLLTSLFSCQEIHVFISYFPIGKVNSFLKYIFPLGKSVHFLSGKCYNIIKEVKMNKLKLLRETAGMTQTELGKLLNVKDSAISKYESGKIPLTDETLLQLAEIFNVSIDYLLGKDHLEQEQEEPVYTSQRERCLLDIYRNYEDNGYTSKLIEQLSVYFPELQNYAFSLNELDKKFLFAFRKLNEDNRDIILGEMKKYLKEQHYEENVAAVPLMQTAK